jgi:hypothetical protein
MGGTTGVALQFRTRIQIQELTAVYDKHAVLPSGSDVVLPWHRSA